MSNPKETLKSIGLGAKSGKKRSIRVAEAIRNELATLLLLKAQDPQLADVVVTRVQLADDLQYARIFFTVSGDKARQVDAEKGLQRAKGFMRSHLARVLNMRYTPELHFVYDHQLEEVVEVERLLHEIAREREEDNESGS